MMISHWRTISPPRTEPERNEVIANERARPCILRGDYWLYAVYHCATPTPQMVRVQDRFEKLLVRPFTRTQVLETVREVSGVRIARSQVMEVRDV